MSFSGAVSYEEPTVVSHHLFIPCALVSLFNGGHILWKRSPCSSLPSLKFSGKKSKWSHRKCNFNDMLAPVVENLFLHY